MSRLASADIIHRLVGVIDLLDGCAVHAIAGDRDHYRPLEFCRGDPLALSQWYAELGVSRQYIADLDALMGRSVQAESIDAICQTSAATETLVDIGWTGDPSDTRGAEIASLAVKHPGTLWIAATESAKSVTTLSALAASVGPERVLLGLDFRDGELMTSGPAERIWIEDAVRRNCAGAVILDLASVGTSQGPATVDICRRVRRLAPNLTLYSGGGIRSAEDVRMLTDAGCDRCLVATALHQ